MTRKLQFGLVLLSVVFSSFLVSQVVCANSLDWSGKYRFESLDLNNPELDSGEGHKAYMLHHLVLRPKIIAADGVNIYVRMDVLNDARYPSSQLGSFLGHGPAPATGQSGTDERDSSSVAKTQVSETLLVNEAYMQWSQEYGALIVGRAPLQFGLGVTYSAGNGDFDHWFTNRDMVAYKIASGNFTMMPAYGKMKSGYYFPGEDINDAIFILNYDNQETGLKMGVAYLKRVATTQSNDAPAVTMGNTVTDAPWNTQSVNLFVNKQKSDFDFGMEVGFVNGHTGVSNPSNRDMTIESYGVAAEANYRPEKSKWQSGVKFGIASGDDPTTTDRYEGFLFDPNYKVAMILFNHPVGKANFFGTGIHRSTTDPATKRVDDEVISNVNYISPSLTHYFSDQTNLEFRFTYANLARESLVGVDMKKDLGYEIDTTLTTRPYEKFVWEIELGMLFPGSAFKGGTNDYTAGFAWGFATKAAISF